MEITSWPWNIQKYLAQIRSLYEIEGEQGAAK